jgi:ABC-2 type transport system permease protein
MTRLNIIKNYFIRNAFEEMFASSKKMKPVFAVMLMIFIVVMLSMPFTVIISEGYGPLHAMRQEGILLSIILSIGESVSFIFGMYTIINILYFSNDIEVILPLPFKSSEIVFGKFMAVLINMYVYTSMLILPLIVYGFVSKASFLYYLYGIIVLLITPIIPMVLASLICMILMRFTSLSKHKDAFRVFTGCASLILIVGFNLFTSSSGRSTNSQQMIQRFSDGNNSAISTLNDIFITSRFSSNALLYNNDIRGLLNILMSLCLSLIIFIIYYYIGGKLYLKGVIGISETYSKRENILENGKADKIIKENSKLKALIIKDVKILFRTPQFFINCIAMMFYMPAVMGVAFFSGGKLSEYRYLLNSSPKWNAITIAIAFVGGTVCIMSGGAGASALSREGKDFIVSKYIPVEYKTQLYSKILSSLFINEFGMVIVVLGLLLVNVSPIIILLGTISSFGSILMVTLLGLYIDFKSPKLEWENEKAMFKNNYIPLLIMLIIFILGAGLVVAAIILRNYVIIFGICIIISLVGSSLLYKGLLKNAYKIYNEK